MHEKTNLAGVVLMRVKAYYRVWPRVNSCDFGDTNEMTHSEFFNLYSCINKSLYDLYLALFPAFEIHLVLIY